MANIQVIYQSVNGKTQKVAEAIAEVCGVRAIDIEHPSSLNQVDLLFVGACVNSKEAISDSLLDYLDQLPANTIRGAVVFSVSKNGVDHTELAVNILMHKGITIYPKHFTVSSGSLFGEKHPNEEDLKKAQSFAREVLDAFNG